MAALAAVAVAVGSMAVAATADRSHDVVLAFAPAPGTRLEYRTDVESITVTDAPGQAAETVRDDTSLQVVQDVVGAVEDGVLVDVALTQAGIGTRRFTVRFDRAAQLSAFEAVEGVPAAAIGDLGLADIFPPGAGAPPDRPLAPGDRWRIDTDVPLDDVGSVARLEGEGRLLSLGVEDGHDVATVRSRTRLPVETERLFGVQVTEVVATYDLADGTVRRSHAVTTGAFQLLLEPPANAGGDPVEGTLRVELRSTTRRVA